MKAAILTDTTKCIGCNECVIACKTVHHLPPDAPRRWDVDDGLSARNWTSIVEGPKDSFVRKQCRHCDDPACVSACPVGAMTKSPTGAVIYDSSKCMGCRYCMIGCPFGIPKYEWSKAIPTVKKCILCNERVVAGKQTACAEACPTGATLFGERDELLAEARKRLRENPSNYVNHIYGEREVGGTSVMMLSSVPFEQFDLKPFAPQPLPELTGKVLARIPDVVRVGVTVLGGVYWITNRRDVVANAERVEKMRDRNQKDEK